MYDDSILPPMVAIGLGLILNIGAPIVAAWGAVKFARLALLFHGAAFLFVLTSPLTAMILGLPFLQPDEEPGPGDGFAFLPLAMEAAAISLIYCAAGAFLLLRLIFMAVSKRRAA